MRILVESSEIDQKRAGEALARYYTRVRYTEQGLNMGSLRVDMKKGDEKLCTGVEANMMSKVLLLLFLFYFPQPGRPCSKRSMHGLTPQRREGEQREGVQL